MLNVLCSVGLALHIGLVFGLFWWQDTPPDTQYINWPLDDNLRDLLEEDTAGHLGEGGIFPAQQSAERKAWPPS